MVARDSAPTQFCEAVSNHDHVFHLSKCKQESAKYTEPPLFKQNKIE